MANYDIGFVYVMSNEAMPGLVKIGRSSRLPEDRAKELHTTALPYGFDVVFRLATSWSADVERRAHKLLAAYRETPNREFFRTSSETAVDAVRQAALETSGINAWARQPTHHLRSGDRIALSLRAEELFVLIAYPDMMAIMSGSAEIIGCWQAHADGDSLEIFATTNPGHVAGLSDGDPGGDVDPVPFLDRDETAPNGLINGRERLVPGNRLLWLGLQDGAAEATSVLFETRCYCQVVGRTWDPKFSLEGYPLLMNFPSMDKPPAAVLEPIQKALTLSVPRTWAPQHPEESEGWALVGTNPPAPAYWLRQLDPSRERRSTKGKRGRDSG